LNNIDLAWPNAAGTDWHAKMAIGVSHAAAASSVIESRFSWRN
jgi:hypothetical protein